MQCGQIRPSKQEGHTEETQGLAVRHSQEVMVTSVQVTEGALCELHVERLCPLPLRVCPEAPWGRHGPSVRHWKPESRGSALRDGRQGRPRARAQGCESHRSAGPCGPLGRSPSGPAGRYSRMSAHSSCGSFLERVASTCLPTSSKITGLDSRFIMSMDISCVLARSSSA